jgi:hypothetical protein
MQADAWISTAEVAWREPFGVSETPAEYVFLRPRLYLETTIPSYLTARISRDLLTARQQRITTRWWNSWRTNFDIHVSDYVRTEAGRGDAEMARRRLELIEPYPLLKADEQSTALLRRLMAECGLPDKAETDAAHVAVAAVHALQFVLTWNCAHLANPVFSTRLAKSCESAGYECPTICTPDQLLKRYEHGFTETGLS